MTNYLSAIAFDIFNLDLVACGIVLGVSLVLAVLFLAVRCNVTYVDMDGGRQVIYKEKHSWLSCAKIHSANKRGKRLVGWSVRPGGKKPLLKHKMVMWCSVTLYAIWEEAPVVSPAQQAPVVAETAPAEVDYSEGMFVRFNYVDTQSDEVIATEGVRINAVVPEEDGVEGWCFAPNGEVVVKNGTENFIFDVNLYPVCALEDDDTVEVSSEPFGGECVVEVAYVKSCADKTVYKESHYVSLKLPKNYETDAKFIGWSDEPDGDVVIERGECDSIFTVVLYSLDSEVEAVAEKAPVAEPVVVEPVAVAEPVAEELGFDDYSEEAVDSVLDSLFENAEEEEPVKPLYEEIIEEYIAPVVVEEPAFEEEPVVEPEPVNEAPLYEEVVEEYIAPVVEEEPIVEPEPVVEEEPIVEPEPVVEEEPIVEPEPVVEPVAEEETEDSPEHTPTIVPTYFDNEGNKIDIKYSRSFTANIIQSDDTVKNYYSELKNHILSYKGVKSRISWKFDSYNRGRDQLFKIKLRGKTVCLYCALDPNEFDQSKYHHEAIDAKIFADVPMLVKIKSGLGLRKAKELVDIVMAKFGIVKDEKAKEVDYVAKYPYEPNEPLLARKLIKLLEADSNNVVKSNKPKEEPIVEVAPVVEEEPIVEPEPVVEEEPIVEPEPVVEPEIIVESVRAEEAHTLVEEKHVELHVEEDVDYITKSDNKKAIVNIDTLSKAYSAGELVDIQSMKDKKLIDKKAKCVKVLARGVLDKPLRIKAGEFSGTAIEMILLTGGQAMHVTYKIKK